MIRRPAAHLAWAFSCFLLLAPCLQASDALQAPEEAGSTDPVIQKNNALDWLLNKRNAWGNWVGDTGARLDRFFASTDAIETNNNSFVKIGLKARQADGESSSLEPTFKARLDLPSLKKRLKLIIESETEDAQSLEEQTLERPQPDSSRPRDSTIGAIEVNAKSAHNWDAATSVGLKFRIPADAFWRARGSYRWDISDNWNFQLRENVYYFHSEGWGQRTEFIFENSHPDYVFRSASDARYIHTERRMEFAQVFSILKELSTARAITYQLGVLGENKPEPQTTAYFVQAIYRRKLYEEWLFLEMTPEMFWPRDDNFNLQPALTAKIEVVFSSND